MLLLLPPPIYSSDSVGVSIADGLRQMAVSPSPALHQRVRTEIQGRIDRHLKEPDQARLSLLKILPPSSASRTLSDMVNRGQWRLWMDECAAGRRAMDEEDWATSFQTFLNVLQQSPAFPKALEGLKTLQDKVENVLGSDALNMGERFLLEGYHYYGGGRFSKAAESWEKAKEFGAAPVEPFISQAVRFRTEEQGKRTRQLLLDQGVRLYEEGHYEMARQKLERLIRMDPLFPGATDFLGRVDEALGRLRVARLAEEAHKTAQEAYQQGIWLFGRGRYTEASAQFQKALQADPGHSGAAAYLERLRAEAAHGQDPGEAEKHYWLGVQAMASGRVDEAMREWETSLRYDRSFERARLSLDKVARAQSMGNDSLWDIAP